MKLGNVLWVDDLNKQLAERDATITRQKEMLDEFTRQSHEDRDIIANGGGK